MSLVHPVPVGTDHCGVTWPQSLLRAVIMGRASRSRSLLRSPQFHSQLSSLPQGLAVVVVVGARPPASPLQLNSSKDAHVGLCQPGIPACTHTN